MSKSRKRMSYLLVLPSAGVTLSRKFPISFTIHRSSLNTSQDATLITEFLICPSNLQLQHANLPTVCLLWKKYMGGWRNEILINILVNKEEGGILLTLVFVCWRFWLVLGISAIFQALIMKHPFVPWESWWCVFPSDVIKTYLYTNFFNLVCRFVHALKI